MADQFADLDATAQAELVRRGQVTPLELVDAAIARIENLNPQLNAVIIPLFEKARHQAQAVLPDGPFRGVPFVIKDLTCTTGGDPYHAGMKLLKDLNWKAEHDSYLAAKFRNAGLICVGRANTPELGPIPTTEPVSYGPTHNPWNLDHSPGGSSGGSAASVAARLVPLAHGNDGGGSIRIPASSNGLVGLKPSRGRTSLGPDLSESWNGAIIEHVITQSVRDTAAVLDQVHGYMPGDMYCAPAPNRPYSEEVGGNPGRLRIGLLTHVPSGIAVVHPECVRATKAAAELLASLGHVVEEAYPPALAEPEFQTAFGQVVTAWVARDLAYWSSKTGKTIGPADVEPHTWTLAEMGRTVSVTQYLEASAWLQGWIRRNESWWHNGFDLLLTPTMAEPPVRLGEMVGTAADPMRGFLRSTSYVVFTAPFNVSGQPGISLPLHWTPEGLPVGVQLVAAYGREDLLIRVASQVEQAQPWAGRKPKVCAA